MDCFSVSDNEFAMRIKSLDKQQLESLGASFQRKYELLRSEYQNKMQMAAAPMLIAQTQPVMTEPSIVPTVNEQIMSSPRARRSPRRRQYTN